MLNTLEKQNYIKEYINGRFGEKIKKFISLNGEIDLGTFFNWIFFTQNALKFIQILKDSFGEIICSEYFEDYFLFKLRKEKVSRSIGFYYGLLEGKKLECNIIQYSVQRNNLKYIFNKFPIRKEKKSTDQIYDMEAEKRNDNKGIKIDDELLNNLIIESM